MAEINSISNGTFTLGQTNNLTFQAGPGITITEPSEGTVRIGNDETVLWSANDGYMTGITFSENKNNFERVKIYCYANEQTTAKQQIVEYPTTNSYIPIFLNYANGNEAQFPYVLYRAYYLWDNNGMSIQNSSMSGGHVWLSPTFEKGGSINVASIKITKVIGINRKEV